MRARPTLCVWGALGLWEPGRPTVCVALGLNLGHAGQHFTTALEPQHLFLFTFYFKTKLPRLALNSLCIYPRQVLALSSSLQSLE